MHRRTKKSCRDLRLRNRLILKFGILENALPSAMASLQSPPTDLAAQFVNQMIAAAFQLKAERLLKSDRGAVRVNRPRQISMYLMNTALSLKFTEIAEFYNKDRTTVSHACRVIEELRDDPEFDERIGEFEKTIRTVLELSSTGPLKDYSSDR